MPITVRCECGKVYHVKDELAGHTGRCKACNKSFTIPTTEPPPLPVARAVPPQPTMPEPAETDSPTPPAKSWGFGGLLQNAGKRIKEAAADAGKAIQNANANAVKARQQAFSAGKCGFCSKQLHLFNRNQIERVPPTFRQGHVGVCSACLANLPITCDVCGVAWTVDTAGSEAGCPGCAGRKAKQAWIKHEADPFRKRDTWTMLFVSFGDLAKDRHHYEFHLKRLRSPDGEYLFCLTALTQNVFDEATPLGIAGEESLFFLIEDDVVTLSSVGHTQDIKPVPAGDQQIYLSIETAVFWLPPLDLLTLVEAETDMRMRMQTSRSGDLDFTIPHRIIREPLQYFAEQMDVRGHAEQRLKPALDLLRQMVADAPAAENKTAAPPPAPVVDADDVVGKFKKIKALLDAGVLTAEEYEAKKAELMKRL